MTQVVLAQLAGVDQARISKIERGKEVPTLAVLLRLAEALNLTMAETVALGRELVNLPVQAASPNLSALPLELDGQAVELLELVPAEPGWIALVRPVPSETHPEPTARRVLVSGLSFLSLAAVRAA